MFRGTAGCCQCSSARRLERAVRDPGSAAVHRQPLDFQLRDRCRDLASRRFQERSFGCDRHRRVHATDVQRHGQIECSTQCEIQRSHGVGEPRTANLDLIRPDSQIGKPKPPFRVSGRISGDVGLDLPSTDRGPGHDGTLRVDNPSSEARVIDCFLGIYDGRQPDTATRRHDCNNECPLHQLPPIEPS